MKEQLTKDDLIDLYYLRSIMEMPDMAIKLISVEIVFDNSFEEDVIHDFDMLIEYCIDNEEYEICSKLKKIKEK